MTVAIPKVWASFFCSLLRDSSNFAWAKDFVLSNYAALLNPNGPATMIEVPKKPHSKDSETCLKLSDWQPIFVEEEDSLGDDNNSTEESLVSQPKEIKNTRRLCLRNTWLTLKSEGATGLRLEIKVSSRALVEN